ncbi:MAG TPA: hydantoinase/oxoprolinase family protein [Methylotenera sp.]|nr:hydantoinase/oxoprolinase family protein [Methylotenera sp.]HPH04452.1 hydantoinase/oxoprolinase family protein [Methylotenera sp.]HPN00857.1 hydantoinase/oxoprolinase family protein [Methylotenera sp.]
MMIGWDIGGAHLKAVQIDVHGEVQAAMQVYCPLWRGLHELAQAFDTILSAIKAEQHRITMTGELADIFENRHAGVTQIAQIARQKLGGNIQFFAGEKGYVSLAQVPENAVNIASMNWLASVQFVAQNIHQALFLDIGSTTTDIALICYGKPRILGFNDAARLQTDELVYTGVVRTPLMALTPKIAFKGHAVNVAAEHFATTADIYTLTGELPLNENMADTADGADKTSAACAKRIARMVGMDSADAPLSTWTALAKAFKDAQLSLIQQAVLRQLSRVDTAQNLTIVGCGAGDFLAIELAQQLNLHYHSVTDLINANKPEMKKVTAMCFPAFAVASLGQQNQPIC